MGFHLLKQWVLVLQQNRNHLKQRSYFSFWTTKFCFLFYFQCHHTVKGLLRERKTYILLPFQQIACASNNGKASGHSSGSSPHPRPFGLTNSGRLLINDTGKFENTGVSDQVSYNHDTLLVISIRINLCWCILLPTTAQTELHSLVCHI